jgi:hypothetical protein
MRIGTSLKAAGRKSRHPQERHLLNQVAALYERISTKPLLGRVLSLLGRVLGGVARIFNGVARLVTGLLDGFADFFGGGFIVVASRQGTASHKNGGENGKSGQDFSRQ